MNNDLKIKQIKTFASFLSSLKFDDLSLTILASFNNFLNNIYSIYKTLNDDEKKIYLEEFREIICPISDQSFFLEQVRLKPRGYAGDFITQEAIWFGRKGNFEIYKDRTKLGKTISWLSYNTEACRANEYRVLFLSEVLDEYKGKRIASLACGSGIEFWDKPKDFFISSKVFLLDQDKGALDRIETQIGNTTENVEFIHQNIFKFIVRPKEVMGERDLIYLFGLFDYLSIELVKKTIKKLWPSLASKGELIFTNAIPKNPTRAFMELIAEWYLDYKTTETILEVIYELPNIKRVEYFIDDMKVYQYIRIQKE